MKVAWWLLAIVAGIIGLLLVWHGQFKESFALWAIAYGAYANAQICDIEKRLEELEQVGN